LLTIGVNNQQNRARSGSNCQPALLVLKRKITLGNCIGIVEDQDSSFKPNIVFPKIVAILVFIPLKSHSSQ